MNLNLKYLMMILMAAAITGCDPTDTVDEMDDTFVESGVAPSIQLEVPSLLTDDGGGLSKSLDAAITTAGNARSLFNPFRRSLHFTNHMIRRINKTLERINDHNIPADTTRVMASGDSMVVTTDTNADYAKHIEVFTADGKKFLELNYNDGENKIYAVFKPDNRNDDSGVDWIDVLYDGTGDNPTMTSSLILGGADESESRHRHGKKLFVELSNVDGTVNVQGGVLYDYQYGADSSANPTPYKAEHTYMYQAVVDTTNPGALVNLHFPPSSVDAFPLPRANYGDDVLDIVFAWVNYADNTQIQSRLQRIIDMVPDSSYSYATPEGLRSIFEYISTNRTPSTGLDNQVFLMTLTNPIAFNLNSGYVAHGDSIDATFTAIGDPSEVTFSMTPAEISSLTIEFVLP